MLKGTLVGAFCRLGYEQPVSEKDMSDWQPNASIEMLKARAGFMASIRQFFADRDVLEVETPLLSNGTVTDVHLDAFSCQFPYHHSGEDKTLFLQTSPEFAMKRLLCAGSGPIYQICKSFRCEEAGRFHNPEFTMLEWYRPDFDDHQLMDELEQLVQTVLQVNSCLRLSYQEAFLQHLNLDPLSASFAEVKELVMSVSQDDWLLQENDKDVLLQWLFSMHIESKLGDERTPCFVYDFPATQASLAKLNKLDNRVAHRFELYFNGVELANGFYELQDAAEQEQRFIKDNHQRKALGLPEKPIDKMFLQALEHGLPDCAGVALGLDRLFMLQQNLSHIEQALSFNIDRA